MKKNNRLTMEQMEIFTRESYKAMMETMRPVYGQTKGLGNKAITRAVAQALKARRMERSTFLPICGKNTAWQSTTTPWSISIFQKPTGAASFQETAGVRRVFPLYPGGAAPEGEEAGQARSLCDETGPSHRGAGKTSSLPTDGRPVQGAG